MTLSKQLVMQCSPRCLRFRRHKRKGWTTRNENEADVACMLEAHVSTGDAWTIYHDAVHKWKRQESQLIRLHLPLST